MTISSRGAGASSGHLEEGAVARLKRDQEVEAAGGGEVGEDRGWNVSLVQPGNEV